MEKTVFVYLPGGYSDWEAGLVLAELNSQRFFDKSPGLQVRTFALDREPVRTMGGFTILPDLAIGDLKKEEAAMLILPGGESWEQSGENLVLRLADDFLKAAIPVAAICGATEAMARCGMLNTLAHTSNDLEQLKATCPDYSGAAHYRDELAVTAGNLITAGSSASVPFAYHILRKLDVMKPDALEYWYGYFEKHSIEDIYKLFDALQQPGS